MDGGGRGQTGKFKGVVVGGWGVGFGVDYFVEDEYVGSSAAHGVVSCCYCCC